MNPVPEGAVEPIEAVSAPLGREPLRFPGRKGSLWPDSGGLRRCPARPGVRL
jgi:hypothetical protein